ncbi:enhancer of polycomb-like-domain-containing protein [Microdochium trichocladiopsis]|uniref:Enhancer of polycomb-like protein n=1 Tax=Microdochium trichocladiopsis TaxID=1682393 RepID=A0A9P9BRN0_9PEZI|nr:enhancer of polycomb-like-domain-containing protein [Microdochium trichocladiopsis]KAH7032908.1 enhancer of polycomb-like-domain-containing protein [Microdochium trichocladiopsis]
MAAVIAANRRVRVKKLNAKTLLPILREDQVDPSEYESLTTESQIATGVEQAEENEVHLQAALKGNGVAVTNEIPVPPPQKSEASYDELYPNTYVEPRNYLKFSETVEDTLGTLGPDAPYYMTTEDDEFLKTYNTKKPKRDQLSEDDFELIMEVFEYTSKEQAPFAAVDGTAVAYEPMLVEFERLKGIINTKVIQAHGKNTYEYWKARRAEAGSKPLQPQLKFETHQERDDMDPYVCFRRREVRQTRKTRARDNQVAEKLKKLRSELEDGRRLVHFALRREELKRDMLKQDRAVFEKRAWLKQAKVRLNIKGDDDDLINSKPQKRPRTDASQPRAGPQTQLRIQVRPDGKTVEQPDLTLLSDKLAEKENELKADIETKMQNHKKWNLNHVDLTARPLPPPPQVEQAAAFRPAKTQQLMTPPASASDSMEIDEAPKPQAVKETTPFVFTGIPSDSDSEEEESYAFRRRVGRGGRLWVDRRPLRTGLKSPPREASFGNSDQWKYDQDDDEEGDVPTYDIDAYSLRQMKYRSIIPIPLPLFSRRQVDPAALQSAANNRQALAQGQSSAQLIAAKAHAAQVAHGQASSPPKSISAQSPPAPAVKSST